MDYEFLYCPFTIILRMRERFRSGNLKRKEPSTAVQLVVMLMGDEKALHPYVDHIAHLIKAIRLRLVTHISGRSGAHNEFN